MKLLPRILLLVYAIGLLTYAFSDDPFLCGGPGFGATQKGLAILGGGLVFLATTSARLSRLSAVMSTAAFVALVFAELLLELVLGSTLRPPYQQDEKLLFKLRPGATGIYQRMPINGGEVITHQVNSRGFRGPELERGERPRIVVYGDSFVHSAYLEEQETFVRQLEALLSARGFDYEVINAGVSSYGPDQVSLRLETELGELDPSLVLLVVFGGNDYGDLLRNKLFKLGAEGELTRNTPKLAPEVVFKFELAERESILKRALSSVLGGGSVQEAPIDYPGEIAKWLEVAEHEYQDYVVDGNDVVTNTYMDFLSADIAFAPERASAQYKTRLMQAVLARIGTQVREASKRFGLVVIPHPFDVCESYDGFPIRPEDYPDYRSDHLSKPLTSKAAELSLPCLDLAEGFHGGDASELYFRGGNDHWNAKGQKLAAELTMDFLSQQGLVTRDD